MNKKVRVLDKILTHVTIIVFLFFMGYSCQVVPESPIVPFVSVAFVAYFLWILLDIFFWFNDRRSKRDIQKYINSGFDPRRIRRN